MIDCNLKSRNAIWWLRPLLQLKNCNFKPFMKTKMNNFISMDHHIWNILHVKMRKTAFFYIQLIICINLKILKLGGCMTWQTWNWCISRFIFFFNARLSIIRLWFGYIYPKFSGEQLHLQKKKDTAEITKTTKKLCSNCPPFFWNHLQWIIVVGFCNFFLHYSFFQIPRSHLFSIMLRPAAHYVETFYISSSLYTLFKKKPR